MRALEAWKATRSRPVAVVIGTRAQLIKMAPLLCELERCGHSYQLVFTGQHTVTMQALLDDFGVTTRPEYIYTGREVSGIGRMVFWLPLIMARLLRCRRRLFHDAQGNRALVIVHGDTFSTLAGALAGRLAGCPVAHVESGLRSFSLLNPFPEEITRLLVFRLADIAFCPGEWAAGNMAGYPLEIVDTGQNTLLDALRTAVAAGDGEGTDPPVPPRYCVASIHRFENIFFRRRLEWIVGTIERIAAELEVVFVLHPATAERLQACGLLQRLRSNARIHCRDRMPYMPFIRLLRNATFVVTDGGSNQEELFYMSKPTLVLRNATERKEGLGEKAVLCGFDDRIVEQFMHRAGRDSPSEDLLGADIHPCRRIVDYLRHEPAAG